MHSHLSTSFYGLLSNICKIFGMSEKFLSCLNFSVFPSETCIFIGMYLCVHDLRAGDWSQSKWQHFSLSVTAIGRICIPILSNKPIKRAGCTVSGNVSLWRLLGGDSGKSYCSSQVWKDPTQRKAGQTKTKQLERWKQPSLHGCYRQYCQPCLPPRLRSSSCTKNTQYKIICQDLQGDA